MLKEYGVVCVKCKAFIRINSYDFDPPLKTAPHFIASRGGETLRCTACGDVCTYGEVDVVHRTAALGADKER